MKYWIFGGFFVVLLFGGVVLVDNVFDDWVLEIFIFDNGMDVVVLFDYCVLVVMYMVWYKVGVVDEDFGKFGIVYLFEYVMFKEIDDIVDGEFDLIILCFGGQNNVFISWDYMVYYECVVKQYFGKMMEFEVECMIDLIIDEDLEGSFIIECDVVKEE